MQPKSPPDATSTADRGSYGERKKKHVGAGGVLLLVGLTVAVYALSPGARHFYRHGQLPQERR